MPKYVTEPDQTLFYGTPTIRLVSLAPSSASCWFHRSSHSRFHRHLLHLIPYAMKTSPGLVASRLHSNHHNARVCTTVFLYFPGLLKFWIQVNLLFNGSYAVIV
jgi:hypothetical protein